MNIHKKFKHGYLKFKVNGGFELLLSILFIALLMYILVTFWWITLILIGILIFANQFIDYSDSDKYDNHTCTDDRCKECNDKLKPNDE